jgi:MoaA/NifB/PqqE/SkfB family radical SAM enzyme
LKFNPTRFAVVDREGNLKFPNEIRDIYNPTHEAELQLEMVENGSGVRLSSDCLSRVYIEPTNQCNLECRTCIRNVWEESSGMMQWEVFERILSGIQAFSPIPTIFLGGFGEPLVHPKIIEMIRAVKELGCCVELITNGILLSENISKQLVDIGLDVLWISIDGVTPESYADVRLGASLPTVLYNLDSLLRIRDQAFKTKPQVGIACVAMKRNIHELPELIRLVGEKGIELFSISNILAYTPELKEEVMYERTLIDRSYPSNSKAAETSYPHSDRSVNVLDAYQKALQDDFRFQLAGDQVDKATNRCPFVSKGSTSIRWDGELSPCLPLLHTYDSYLGNRLRRSRAYSFGNISVRSLVELWDDPDYIALRQRLQVFDFSPCTFCNSCEMADANLEDCFGNSAPTCGGCLWAQGLIQCP